MHEKKLESIILEHLLILRIRKIFIVSIEVKIQVKMLKTRGKLLGNKWVIPYNL